MSFENELFDDLDIAEEKNTKSKEEIVDKKYQLKKINVNDKRGEYVINPVLDDNNNTIKKYNITTLNIYDDKSLKHFKDKESFLSEKDEFSKSKYIHQYKDYSNYIKDNKIKPIRITLPSKDSYNKKLLKDRNTFLNESHNELHDKLSSNIKKIWTECDVFQQYFKNVINTYFYGKIYRYINLDGEETINDSGIILFEVRGKALPAEWTFKFNELKKDFHDLDSNQFDKESYIEYMKELFSRDLDKPKQKLLKMWFSKVSENPKSAKNMPNDNDCIISHQSLKQPPKSKSGTLNEEDFMYEFKEKIDDEWVAKKERMTLNLSNIISLDTVYDENNHYHNIKFDNTNFDESWYKNKIIETDRIIREYQDNKDDVSINEII